MASRGASSRSTSGSQRLFGKASLVGHTVRAKIGGRVTALAIPGSEASRLERISQEPVEQRRLRAHPEYGLDLEHAYGYTEGCQNLHATGRGSYCYTLSALGIVWNEESKQQSFFTGHTAEITAIAFCSSSGLIATGQKFVGSESCGIRIWSMDQKPKQKCQVLGHSQSVYSLAFSADGRWLFSIAADERGRSKGHSSSELNATTSPMCVWRLDDSRLKTGLRQARSAQVRLVVKEKVRLVPHPEDSHRLLAFGGRAAYLVTCDWAAKDAARTASWLSPSPPFDPNGLSFYNFSAGCFVPGQKDLVVLAVTSGVFVVDAAESGPVCRYGVPLENVEVRFLLPLSSGHLLCGGSGTCLSLLDPNLSKVEAIKITGVATSTLSAACLLDSDTLMAGTVDGSLCRLSLHLDAGKCHGESLQQSPSGTAEVEALAINPAALNSLAVGDSSGMVFLYDLNAKELVSSVGPFQGAVTSMAWHPRGQLLVLGLESGNLHGLLVGNSGTTPTDVEIKAALSEPTEVTAARFSPDGNWLAVGHRDGRVQVLASESTCSLTQYRQLPGNASAIMGLQFTKDGSTLGSNARDGAVLCWEVETGKMLASNFPAENWFGDGHSFRLTISWAMWGAWNKESYRSSAALHGESHGSLRLLAVGDEDGLVKLHRFPLPIPDAQSKDYHAHTSRIADLSWAGPDRLVTAGTGRCALLQWRLVSQRRSDGAQPKPSGEEATHVQKSPRPRTTSASIRSAASSDAGQVRSRVSTSGGRSKSPPKVEGPYRRPSSALRRQSPSREGSGRTSPRGSRGTQLSASMDPMKVHIAAKMAKESRSKDASVQTDSFIAAPGPGVILPQNYGARFIAVDRNLQWQVYSQHPSPVRLISPPRLISAPAALSQPPELRTRPEELPSAPASPATLLSPRALPAGVAPFEPISFTQPLQLPSLRFVPTRSLSPTYTPPARGRTPPVSQRSSPVLGRRIVSIPSTPNGVVLRSVTPQPPPRMVDSRQKSDFKLQILSGHEKSSIIAVADVYLYRPPFPLEKAVSYGFADGATQELFSLPPGWGVLRSSGGVLLWLSLKEESCQFSANQYVVLELANPEGSNAEQGAPPCIGGSGTWQSPTTRPVAADQGLLRLATMELVLQLEANLDDVLKSWLGFLQQHGASL